MDDSVRHSLADRAFLFDDPDAYLAGVDAALQALEQAGADQATPAREPRSPARSAKASPSMADRSTTTG